MSFAALQSTIQQRRISHRTLALVLVPLLGCGDKEQRAEPTTSGAPGMAAAGSGLLEEQAENSGGASGSQHEDGNGGAAAESTPLSALPVPAGTGVPQPSGATANLRVLDWAGFKAAASYTFDDSQPSQIEHYAEIQAAGVPVTFYATTNGTWASNYKETFRQAVVDGHELGNHTVNHCYFDLSSCGDGSTTGLDTVDAEIDECTQYIVDDLGQPAVWTIAYPFGDTDYEDASASRFLLGRGVNGGMVAPNDTTDPFRLPVVAAAGDETPADFNDALDAAQAGGEWVLFLFHSLLPTSNNWYAGVEIASVTDSIAYGKQLGDVWLDSVINVGAYWVAQKMLNAAAPVMDGENLTWSWTLPDHFPPGKFLRVQVDGGTLSQNGVPLVWDEHGYYEVALDVGLLSWTP